ncbi:MAG: hypothetical protein R3F31_24395 [Verrucomicrobiales bacterium]|nr:hypothetical protein [Verrucomicrobiae bacterium]MCP5554171.1 hypothetical protein [Akkermansiaceae bacterium]HRX56892.1 hypothetical protein [Verrucomicrobiales bacterium]
MHEFWHLLVWSSVAWYSSVTLYVTIRGALDIREMVKRLDATQEEEDDPTGGTTQR